MVKAPSDSYTLKLTTSMLTKDKMCFLNSWVKNRKT